MELGFIDGFLKNMYIPLGHVGYMYRHIYIYVIIQYYTCVCIAQYDYTYIYICILYYIRIVRVVIHPPEFCHGFFATPRSSHPIIPSSVFYVRPKKKKGRET